MAGKGAAPLQLLAVPVLTSFDENDLRQMGYSCSVSDLVELRVRNAMEAGVDGIVCSPVEVGRVRSVAGPGAILVTPGVRSMGAAAGDQKRVATPAQAIRPAGDARGRSARRNAAHFRRNSIHRLESTGQIRA